MLIIKQTEDCYYIQDGYECVFGKKDNGRIPTREERRQQGNSYREVIGTRLGLISVRKEFSQETAILVSGSALARFVQRYVIKE